MVQYGVVWCGVVFQYHCWYFTPTAAEKYVLRPVLSTWSVRQSSRLSDGRTSSVTVRVVAEGATPSLVVRCTLYSL